MACELACSDMFVVSCVLASSAVIGAEPLKGLAVGDLLKVYAELGWGDVRDDFKKLSLKLKHPPTAAAAAATTSSSASGAATSAAEVDASGKRLNTSASAVAAAERAELLMSAIHQDNDNENDSDTQDDPSGGKLGGSEDRGISDDFRGSPTKPHLQLGSGQRALIVCAEADADADDDDSSPLALSPTGSGSDPSASPPADPASGAEPFSSDFGLELSTAAETENRSTRASTSAAASAADVAQYDTWSASSPAVSAHILQSHMRLDS